MKGSLKDLAAWIAAAFWLASPVSAATFVNTIRVDLNPLIDQAAHSKEQFAVNIAHSASISTRGAWSRHDATSTWVYSARVPTAVSLSFHASGVVLPPSAVLTVTTPQTTVKYSARDVSRSGLWGRPMPGDTLNFSLSVNSSEASRVQFRIESLQAGYRSLGAGVPDHPHYRELQRTAAASTSCTENFSCHATTANQGPSNATVALLIGNLYECTGTLLNDTSADGAPYVLTARHCQTGQLGGGNPGAAATVSVYWNAVTPCGSNLGSIYDGGTPTQYGATTVLEQQDIWLLQLDTPPAATDAFYAGWDASGSTFSGGYTIHHAQGENQQYVAWNGIDFLEQIPGPTLNALYNSTFWGVVNSVGNLGAGGSGSALFSPNNQVVGSASLAELVAENSVGVCPANPPASPTPSTVTALFTALSGVWTSTADPTSSTAAKTLKSLLDPNGTGQMTTVGLPTQPITITTNHSNANTGDTVTLTWNVQGASSCTAWGGATGDGWAGVQPASGSAQITNATGGAVNYSLSCHAGNQIAAGTVAVSWDYIQPLVNVSGSNAGPLMLGATTALNWDANVGPCVATGGNAGDGWAGAQPASGGISLTITKVGATTYTLTCGTGQRTATSSLLADGVAPQITLTTDTTQTAAGSTFQLSWFGNGTGGACAGSGGSSTDNWALNNGHDTSNGSSLITEAVPGTYTYTMTCTGGGESASSTVTVVVTGDPAAISLTALAPEQQVGTSDATLNLLWTSNVFNCFIDWTSNSNGHQGINLFGGNPQGAVAVTETAPGLVTYTMSCRNNLTATATINWVTTPTPSVLTVTSSSWAANVAYPISWNATAGPCVASGGAPGDGWAGSKAVTGTQSVTESQQGTYVFTLVCGSGSAATTSQLAVTVPPPFIQIYASGGGSPGSTLLGPPLVWRSTVGPCTYFDGSVPNNNGEPVPPSGSATPTTAGIYVYSLACGSGANALYAAAFAQVPPNVPTTLTASAASIAIGRPVTLTWTSDGSSICYASGGTGQPPWSGNLGTTSGSVIVTSTSAGSVTYGIGCGSKTAQAVVNYVSVPATSANAPTPTVSFSASAATQTAGQSVSLVWSSNNADSCSASGGMPGDGWTGSLSPSGSKSVSETSAGSVTYSITCTGAPPAAAAATTVVITSAVTTATGGTGSHGGGALDRWVLLCLGLLLYQRARADIWALMYLAWRRARATMVRVGLAEPGEVKALPSEMNRLGMS